MSDRNEAVMVAKGLSPVHVRLRSRLASLLAASVALDLVASVVICFAEQGQSGTGIKTFGDALFWTSTQLLTVSSNLPNPLSTPARILDVVLQIWAISIVAILAGSFGAFFHHRGMEDLTRDTPAWMMSRDAGRVTLPGRERSCHHHARAGDGGPRRLGTCRVNRGRPSARRRARRGGPLIRWAGGATPGFGTAGSSAARTAP